MGGSVTETLQTSQCLKQFLMYTRGVSQHAKLTSFTKGASLDLPLRCSDIAEDCIALMGLWIKPEIQVPSLRHHSMEMSAVSTYQTFISFTMRPLLSLVRAPYLRPVGTPTTNEKTSLQRFRLGETRRASSSCPIECS
eukprot:4928172-Amphidinium_carterae.1